MEATVPTAPIHTPNPELPPLGDGPRKKMNVVIDVPENWENRLDMQWVVEREIQADRWGWSWPKEMALSIPTIEANEFNAGLVINDDGTPSHWLILNTAEHADNANHATQMEWAKSLGLDLPTRKEQSLLFANAKQFFDRDWYWSNETHADDAGWAWYQHFDNGGQLYYNKGDTLRARAVRRFPA